jgi:hypothetical protein
MRALVQGLPTIPNTQSRAAAMYTMLTTESKQIWTDACIRIFQIRDMKVKPPVS